MTAVRTPFPLLVTALLATACDAPPGPPLEPNIVMIVADDLGYSDLGSFGGEISTPNLDSLAAHGVQFTNFHTAPTCGPTRAMLMTGLDHHPVGMAANAAALRRVTALRGRPGYEGRLNDSAVTAATLLADAGYQTYLVGKWDLGNVAGSRPVDRGFQKSFGLGSGGASHFSDMLGALATDDRAHYMEGASVVEALPDDFYSTRFYTEQAVRYIEEGDPGRPFFAYVAYTAPHWPLQVPDDWLDRYRGRYDGGWHELARERARRQAELGLFAGAPEYRPLRGVADWESLPAEERRIRAREMEIYAAMVEYLDWQIGLLLERVDALPTDRDTLILFLSDNGPEGNAIDRIGPNGEWIERQFDNSFDNLGRRNSYLFTGPGWAQASAQPFTLYKSFVAEGGIRAPLIVSYAGVREGTRSNALVTASDIPATVLAAAGVAHPGSRYRGREILPMEGLSLLPLADGSVQSIHSGQAIGWELYGNRAVIRDDYKATLIWPPAGDGTWKLYDYRNDPAERNDLGAAQPDVLDSLIEDWRDYAERNAIYLFEEDNGYGRF